MNYSRKNNRRNDELREIKVIPEFCSNALGSVLYQCGGTHVICAVTQSSELPRHAQDMGTGWLTAEYTLLPYSTNPRTERRMQRPDGRSVEIQRLIGRSLRTAVDLHRMRGVSLTVDCDVLKADGGTRTAAITGAYIALEIAVQTLLKNNMLAQNPITKQVAAVSTGYIGDTLLLDLDYEEDFRCDVDMNVVMDSGNSIIEVQGTGEKRTYTFKEMDTMMTMAAAGINNLFSIQNDMLKLCRQKPII